MVAAIDSSRSSEGCWAISAAMASVSELECRRTPSACSSARSSVVLVRLPLCPRAIVWPWPWRTTGWAFCQTVEPVVEYRAWPMAMRPGRPDSLGSSNTWLTRPMSFIAVTRVPSETAMPADSCPRCCSAYSPKKVSRATSRSGSPAGS